MVVVVIKNAPQRLLGDRRLLRDPEIGGASWLHVNIAVEEHEGIAGEAGETLDVILGVVVGLWLRGALEDDDIPASRRVEQVHVLEDEDAVAVLNGGVGLGWEVQAAV